MTDSNKSLSERIKIYDGASLIDTTFGLVSSIGNNSKVKNCKLSDYVRIDRNNHIESSRIGSHSYTGRNTIILYATVGSFTSISWNVSIGGANHDYTRITQHSFLYNDTDKLRPQEANIPYDRFSESVTIGNDVWIAAGAVITRGVIIGDGAVIGANSVVTKDVPPYAIVVGSPARVIKYRFSDEIIERLLKLSWWTWSREKIMHHFEQLSSSPTIDGLNRLLEMNND